MSRFGLRTRSGTIRSFSETTSGLSGQLLLNTYSNAVATYSVRYLNSAYTGPLIRVRRSNDNAEQNIGFDSTGNLDETALSSFVGSNSAFITTWYDQSGNNYNLTQGSATSQPLIVSSGTINKVNNKSALLFDGSNDFLDSTATELPGVFSSGFIMTAVINPTNINAGSTSGFNKRIMHSYLNSNTLAQLVINEGGLDKAASLAGLNSGTAGTYFPIGQSLFTFDPTFAASYSNSVYKTTGFSSAGNPGPSGTGMRIGGCRQGGGLNAQYVGHIQEFLIFKVPASSPRIGVETNINAYYSIY